MRRWDEVDALLAEVMARPREEREAWLESTTSGDPELRAEVMALLEGLHERGTTLIVVTHDRELGARAHRRIAMRDGQIEVDEK